MGEHLACILCVNGFFKLQDVDCLSHIHFIGGKERKIYKLISDGY